MISLSEKDISIVTVEQAKETWNFLAKKYEDVMPFFSFEWYSSWIEAQKDWQPYIIRIGTETIAPFVKRNNEVQFTHAFSDFNDLIGIKKDVWPVLVDYLKKEGIKSVHFENISPESDTVRFFQQYGQTISVSAAKTTPEIVLPPTFDSYLAQIKAKRRKYNKFQRDYPDAVIVESTDPVKDMEIHLTFLEKNPKKVVTLTEEKKQFFRTIMKTCRPYVWFKLLYVGSVIISTKCMFTFGKKVMVYNSAYDLSYPNAGTFLAISTIQEAIEKGFTEFNLLTGKELYKYELGALDKPLYTITGSLS